MVVILFISILPQTLDRTILDRFFFIVCIVMEIERVEKDCKDSTKIWLRIKKLPSINLFFEKEDGFWFTIKVATELCILKFLMQLEISIRTMFIYSVALLSQSNFVFIDKALMTVYIVPCFVPRCLNIRTRMLC